MTKHTEEDPTIIATSAMKAMPSSLDLLPSGEGNVRDVSRVNLRRRHTFSMYSKANVGTEVSTSSNNLRGKLLGDIIVASSITLAISPFLTVIDKSIVQRAAGTHTTAQSCLESMRTIARNPAAYTKSPAFILMWGVYAATYSTANCLKTFMEHREDQRRRQRRYRPLQSEDSQSSSSDSDAGKLGIFAGTSVVNSSLSLLKDQAYAKMFGAAAAAPRVPLITYGLWASRDFMVIGSSFVLPEKMSRVMSDRTGMDKSDALKVAQLACPVATQFIAGPVQLLGLDCYNRPLTHLSHSEAAMERALCIWRGAASVIAARVARIVPGYGIGGIGNTHLRDAWRDMLDKREMKKIVEEEKDHEEESVHLIDLVRDREEDARMIEKLIIEP
uniref:Mitochondrial fission process protein 1 n=1 Tax=Odontella aurita TaxID=265563 RepID=A0A7S4NBQ5_9STRA|mmetsp:Transcript_56432/g.168881  ORF Transcript_56432/g.168881 Transcript_56432/m.168881 type:complete len:387 (+) Transcript_56432:247-1407(+)